jgi:hypothetical protein
MASEMGRLILIVAAMAVLETAWALYSALAGINLLVFYVVLGVISFVFWIPGLAPRKSPGSDS